MTSDYSSRLNILIWAKNSEDIVCALQRTTWALQRLIRQDFEKVHQSVTEVERWVGDMEDTVWDHSAFLHTLQVPLKHLESRAKVVENRNRWNNFWSAGLFRGLGPVCLHGAAAPHAFSQAAFFSVERAHSPLPPLGLCLIRLSSGLSTLETVTWSYERPASLMKSTTRLPAWRSFQTSRWILRS